jgi:hypothetical protein
MAGYHPAISREQADLVERKGKWAARLETATVVCLLESKDSGYRAWQKSGRRA